MFLKKIQLSGFKSFADKISIPLSQGITGIVGPNGSGKSNVIDAVRWVMGEQSAKNLRGKVATDIIFSGSARRKPVGMAEVSLVFDNTDESAFCPPEYRHEPEISLTRRLYADGQREYLINRKPCRLKDILNFFTTTGLGGRSYSMIEQGQVDRILNAKPEDVRIILEEAAGTLVFKLRRDEAQKKLSRTQENLSRIEDIISELDRQQKSLKGQMEKAQEWRELSKELKEQELSLFAHNFHNFNEQLTKLKTEIGEKENIEAEALAKLAQFEAKQVELQNALDEADPGLESLRELVTTVREDIARAESIILNADHRIDNNQNRLNDLAKETEDDAENAKILEAQLDAANTELASATKVAEDLQGQIDSIQAELSTLDDQNNEFLNQKEDFEAELKNISRLLEVNTLRCEAISRERNKLHEEIESVRERVGVLEKDRSAAAKDLEVAEKKAAETQQGLDVDLQKKQSLETSIKERNEQIKLATNTRDQAKEEYISAKTRCSSIRELELSSSDVGSAFAGLKENEGSEIDELCFGLLTDYIAFDESATELSAHAKACFEKWAEKLFVKDIESLNSLVRLVHQHQLGGLPALIAEGAICDEQALSAWAEKYEATPMRQYLKVTKQHPALQKILDRLFILSGLDLSAGEIKDLPAGVVAFTSQGLHFSNQDEFVIGLPAGAKGLLSRKQELEKLESELKTVESKLASCQSEIDQLEALQNEDRLALSEIDQKLKDQNKDVLDVLSEFQSVKQLVEHKAELLADAKAQLERLEAASERGVGELEEQGQSRISLGNEQKRINEELASLNQSFDGVEDKRAEVARVLDQRKLDLAKSEARTHALKQSYEQTKGQLERVQTTLSRRYEEKSRLEEGIQQIRRDCETAKSEIETFLARRETLEKELGEKREENSGILEELREVDSEIRSVHEVVAKTQKAIGDKKIAIERLSVEHESIIAQAQEKYHLDIATYQFEIDPEFSSSKKSAAVTRLRNKIEGLGAINMMAIEEYDQLMARHEFISAQRTEVVNSISVLEDALEEIEETSKVKFLETYETVNAEFVNLFPVLFPGGEARLDLTSPEDPLNSGCEILARLPGKKMQRMSLLSGGEKALTAISLIFALLKTKPTPFCFLDEVDAPLDEANVGRYNRVLQALAERFQFIVITHNRRTMEALDTLFGVTMQEPGVSKIVGVDMRKDLPDHLKKAFKETPRPVEGASVQ